MMRVLIISNRTEVYMVNFARTQSGRIYAETIKADVNKAHSDAIVILQDLLEKISVRPDDEPVIVGSDKKVLFTAESAKEDIKAKILRFRLIINAELIGATAELNY